MTPSKNNIDKSSSSTNCNTCISNIDRRIAIDKCDNNTAPNLDFNFSNRGLNVVCLNIRHIMPKLDEIKYVLSHSKKHILGLCETFLINEIQDSEIQIPNFNCIRRDRDNRKGGGIVVYIKDNIPFKHRLDLNTCSLESVWIEIMFPNAKSFLINFIYRPPDSAIDWVSAYDISF